MWEKTIYYSTGLPSNKVSAVVTTKGLNDVAQDSRCVRGTSRGMGFAVDGEPVGSYDVDLLRGYRRLEIPLDLLGHLVAGF